MNHPTNNAAFVYHDRLTRHVLSDSHVFIPARLRYTYDLLNAYGAFELDNARLTDPRQASIDELRSFHSAHYIEAVKAIAQGQRLSDAATYGFTPGGDNPIYPSMYDSALWTTGASLAATEEILSGRCSVAVNFSGGLHHAMPNHASGFCIFDDPVVAIKQMTAAGARVAYVDIDCHHGDGVQAGFYETDQVLTISLHESGEFLFPGTGFVQEEGVGAGRGYAVNVPLYPHTGDDTYLWAFREVVPPLVTAFKPDVLVTQLGIDTHVLDPITHLRLTVQGYARVVQELAQLSPGKWLALGGGGYNIEAVMRAWTKAYGVMLDHEWPQELPESLRAEHDLDQLDDPEQEPLPPDVAAQVRAYAENSVSEVKRTIFPAHGLSGLA
jgi:acetoin utilization protein AcuC